MRQANRRAEFTGNNGLGVLYIALAALGAIAGLWVTLTIGARIDGVALPDQDPIGMVVGLMGGTTPWPASSTWVGAGVAVFIGVAVGCVMWGQAGSAATRSRVDWAARYLGQGKDLAPLTKAGAWATAQRLGVARAVQRRDRPDEVAKKAQKTEPDMSCLGVPLGTTVLGRTPLFGSWEDMHLDIWGPRTGKTTSRAIPAIVAAPGPVLATSNKRDLVDATRGPRSTNGRRVWVLDPQGIAREEPSWWYNPLSYVVDDTTAETLAEHFAYGSRDPGAKPDAYFDPAGQSLLACFFLAAALDGRPITDVFSWTTQPKNDDALKILRKSTFPLMYDSLLGYFNLDAEQQSGVYGTAQQMASCLKNQKIVPWVTQAGRPDRPEFNPHDFVRAQDTLYSLSKEGKGTAAPLVTALTAATAEAAEAYATTQPGGRLAIPLVGVLDEAANVCRWKQLPDLYSHFGSRGIVLMTILQSFSQGAEVWGEKGMLKLWSASNVKVYGGGIDEPKFLSDLSQLIGDYDKETRSVSAGQRGGSVSRQLRRERIFDNSDLRGIPRGRAVVLASGTPATLIKTVPWTAGPHAASIRASIAASETAAPSAA